MQELPNKGIFLFLFKKNRIRERWTYASPDAKRHRYSMTSSPAHLLMLRGQKAKETKPRSVIYHFIQQNFFFLAKSFQSPDFKCPPIPRMISLPQGACCKRILQHYY